MATIKNVSPLGDLEIPALGIIVLAGATADVSDEAAESLLQQGDNWVTGVATSSKNNSTPTPDVPADNQGV